MVRHLTPRPDSLLCAALAADLDAADLRSEPLRDAWGAEADDALARGIRSPLLRALAARTDPLATLGRLFVLGMPQPLSDVASALPRTGVDGVEELGLAYRSDDLVVPAALIRPQSFVDADGVGSGGSRATSTSWPCSTSTRTACCLPITCWASAAPPGLWRPW